MQDCRLPEILVIETTVGTLEDARRLARQLVEARLAACVHVEPVAASIYRWEGRLHEEPETRLILKTDPAHEAAVEAFLREHHPYEVPQFTVAAMRSSAAYAGWVRQETLSG